MDLGFRDRVAVVTGAARGLGKADAFALAAEGAMVVLVDIIESDLLGAVQEIEARGGKAAARLLDITNREAVAATVAGIESDIGPIDVLVNNAAIIGTVGQMTNYRDDAWDRDLLVNLTGSYNMTRQVYPRMRQRGYGRLLYMASVAGLMGGFGQASYSTTKAGVIGLAKSMALEGARKGVTANVIAPGIIETDAFKAYDAAMIERMVNATAMRRLGKPEEVGDLVAFLCSAKAGYITGSVVPIAGGLDLFVF